MSKSLLTKRASRHLTSAFSAATAAVVLFENTAFPDAVYSTIPLTALAQPSNFALLYPVPCLETVKPVTSFNPIWTEDLASGGFWIMIEGGFEEEYPLPKLLILISVIFPLNTEAVATAPVPPSSLVSTI